MDKGEENGKDDSKQNGVDHNRDKGKEPEHIANPISSRRIARHQPRSLRPKLAGTFAPL
jgi:hypothetical protein